MIRFARSLLIVLIALVAAGTGSARAEEPKVVLFEDPALEANRLHYPLLISDGRGFRIRCKGQADEEAVIRGLGFATVPSEILTAVDGAIVAAAPAANPLLCPSGETYPIKLFAHDDGSGLVYYLQFPSDFGAATFSDRLYIPGCAPLVTALRLDLDRSLNADPTPFFIGKIHRIDCLAGAPLVDRPTSFAKWCVKGDRTPAETASVMAVLDATPGGVSALGSPAACAAAQTFLESITALNLNAKGMQSLEPIAVLTHLTSLSLADNALADNAVADLAPLAKLKALTFLDISGNHVGNVNALAPLIALTRLDVSDNDITDIRALSTLGLLTSLRLDGNKIASLAPLQFLQALATLSIAGNGLTGDMLDPLSALGGLTRLDLSNNRIESFANLGSFSSTLTIDLSGNPIVTGGGQSFVDLCVLHRDAATPLGQTIRAMVELEGGGACLAVGNKLLATTALDLSSKIVSDLTPLATLPQLTTLNLSSNAITDVAPLAGLAQLGRLDLSKNSIVDVRPLASLGGLIDLDLSGNPVQATDFVAACLMRNQADFLTPALAAEVNALLAISGKTICGPALDDLAARQSADAKGRGLTSVSLFPAMGNLTAIDLSDNQLSDVAALSAIPGLTRLSIRNNQIASLQAILPLRRLQQLAIDGNPLPNLIGIGTLGRLTKLSFSNTQVRSVSPLAELPLLDEASMHNLPLSYASLLEYCLVYRFDSIALGDARGFMAALDTRMQADHVDSADCSAVQNWAQTLTSLTLNKKSIITVSPVVYLRALSELNLFDNLISDASPIASLTGLQKLNLSGNRISVLPRFAAAGLKYIFLADNQVTNLANLSNMSALSNIDLRNNRVVTAQPLGSLPALSIVDLRGNRIANFSNVQSVIAKAYLGNNPVCASILPSPLLQPIRQLIAEACKRVPPRIFDIHRADEIAIRPAITCASRNCLQLQRTDSPLIHR